MAANAVELWAEEYQKVTRMIQELEIAGSKALDGRGVEELLESAESLQQLLTEIEVLDAAVERWRDALTGLREAVEAQLRGNEEDPTHSIPALCEADDKYWYL